MQYNVACKKHRCNSKIYLTLSIYIKSPVLYDLFGMTVDVKFDFKRVYLKKDLQ